MRPAGVAVLALMATLAMGGAARAVTLSFFDGDFQETDWTIPDDGGVQLHAERIPTDGNPGAFRRVRIDHGVGAQTNIVNESPNFVFDPTADGVLTGLSISFDAIRLDADPGTFFISIGVLQNGDYDQAFTGLAGVGWQHYEFECIVIDDLQLEPGPVSFAFAVSGFTPFGALVPPYEIGIDNFRVQIQTAPDACDGFGAGLRLTGSDGNHDWSTDPVIPYVLTVTNVGAEPVPAVLSERVPINTSFVPEASASGWMCADDGREDAACTNDLGMLAAGESRAIAFAARVVDGTTPLWDVFNEARAGGATSGGTTLALEVVGPSGSPTIAPVCSTMCTNYDSTPDCNGVFQCCAVSAMCQVLPADDPGCQMKCSNTIQSCVPPAGSPIVPAGASAEVIRFDTLYRLRDRVFHDTPGGEQATASYYRHSPAIGSALMTDPSLVTLAVATLRLWQPLIAAMVQGDSGTITAEHVQALLGFLDALRDDASPELESAIDHGRRRLALETWGGITLAEAVARLDALVCRTETTIPSVFCRLEEASEVLVTVTDGTLAPKLVATLARAIGFAEEATSAAGSGDQRLQRKRLRGVARLARKVLRKAKSKRGRRDLPESVRGEIVTTLGDVPADAKALAH